NVVRLSGSPLRSAAGHPSYKDRTRRLSDPGPTISRQLLAHVDTAALLPHIDVRNKALKPNYSGQLRLPDGRVRVHSRGSPVRAYMPARLPHTRFWPQALSQGY